MRRGPERPPATEEEMRGQSRAAAQSAGDRADRVDRAGRLLLRRCARCADLRHHRRHPDDADQVAGALAAVINGAVRDTPYVKSVGLPIYCAAMHPSASGRDVVPVAYDVPVNMAGVQLLPGDIILADDEGVLAMPLDLAEYVAAHGPAKEHLEIWIRGKVEAGGAVHDYYPPVPEKEAEYERETGRKVEH